MHIGMQSYAAAAHLAARVYNEQQVHCIFSFSLRSRTNCSTKKCSKKSLCRTISFVEKCGHTARQRGRISTPFPLRKAVFTAGKSAAIETPAPAKGRSPSAAASFQPPSEGCCER